MNREPDFRAVCPGAARRYLPNAARSESSRARPKPTAFIALLMEKLGPGLGITGQSLGNSVSARPIVISWSEGQAYGFWWLLAAGVSRLPASNNYRIIKSSKQGRGGPALTARRGGGSPLGIWLVLLARFYCCSGLCPGFLDRHNGTLELAGGGAMRARSPRWKPRGAGAPCADCCRCGAPRGRPLMRGPGDGRHREDPETLQLEGCADAPIDPDHFPCFDWAAGN